MSRQPLPAGADQPQFEAWVSAAVACDPILLRMMLELQNGHANGMDESRFGRLLRLAIESAFLAGAMSGLNSLGNRNDA